MKKFTPQTLAPFRKSALVLSAFATALIGCSHSPQIAEESRSVDRVIADDAVIPYKQFESRLEMTPGKTYLTFMQGTVKPEMDKYDNIIDQVEADAKKTHNFDGMQTTLISKGAGVAIRIDPKNYFFNVGYAKGDNTNDFIAGAKELDQQSGRSYGVGPRKLQSDPSDVAYLRELQIYATTEKENIGDFYSALLPALLNNDPSGWKKLSATSKKVVSPFTNKTVDSDPGQEVATDFMAIYTAEQDRRLMKADHKMEWDDALLQVTLLAAFHSGQKKIQVMYNGNITGTTQKQQFVNPKDHASCEKTSTPKVAGMDDYWQWSRNPDPKNCHRSGINLTRKDFEKLGTVISDFERKKHADLVDAVEAHFDASNRGGNLLAELAAHVINFKGVKAFSAKETKALTEDYVAFLLQVQTDADAISRGH